jgi:hypothetical protein
MKGRTSKRLTLQFPVDSANKIADDRRCEAEVTLLALTLNPTVIYSNRSLENVQPLLSQFLLRSTHYKNFMLQCYRLLTRL